MGLQARPKSARRAIRSHDSLWCIFSLNLMLKLFKLFLSLTSFFHALSLSRSLSNSLETSLTTMALYYYPWDLSHFKSWFCCFFLRVQCWWNIRQNLRRSNQIMLLLAAAACTVRITNAVIWVFMILSLFWRFRKSRVFLLELILDTAWIGYGLPFLWEVIWRIVLY